MTAHSQDDTPGAAPNTQYDDWAEFLLQLQAITGPAELQGMLCGRLAGGQRLDSKGWMDAAISFMDLIDTSLDPDSTERIQALYETTLMSLSDINKPLRLLLPPDETSLRQRLDALSRWCEAFLHGLGSSGLTGGSELAPEVAEVLRDFAQISQAQLDEDEGEENEQHYTELVEYVRMATLSLYSELNSEPPAESTSVH